MLKILFVSYVTLTLGLCSGQVAGQSGAKAGGNVEIGDKNVGASGSVNFNSSFEPVALVLGSVWGSKTDRDMGAETVNRATKEYDVIVKDELNAYYTNTFLTFFYKVPKNDFQNYVNGNLDRTSASKIDMLYGARICDLISKDRDKSYAPDYFFPTEVLHMIFVGRDTCQFQEGSTLVERSKTLTVNVENSLYFNLPDDPVWYLLVTILHYSGIDTPIEKAIIRVGYQVTKL